LVVFRCEHCGKRFEIDDRYGGRRGRCSQCGQVMRIPPAEAPEAARPHAAADQHKSGRIETSEEKRSAEPEPAPPFRLSPPEFHPRFGHPVTVDPPRAPISARPGPSKPVGPEDSVFALEYIDPDVHRPDAHHARARFELLDDEVDTAGVLPASPEIERGMRALEEFQKDRHGYGGHTMRFFGRRSSGPASWVQVKWRAGVGRMLKLLRWVDAWAYLISVPFVILMIFGMVVENRPFVHLGAVVVVLANYGRFWADLLAFFVRPYKDGPLQGLAFVFPPYTLYYLTTHWGKMKPIVRRIATSCIPIVLVVLAYAFLPFVNPAAQDTQGFVPKVKAGAEVIRTEIRSDLETLEGKILPGKPAQN
jgi:hypothetical protein